jgi:hypothetical protein
MSAALARNWWLIALRGAFAILFGIVALIAPGMVLGIGVPVLIRVSPRRMRASAEQRRPAFDQSTVPASLDRRPDARAGSAARQKSPRRPGMKRRGGP